MSREQEIVERAKAIYCGVQDQKIWFTDPQTGSTLTVRLSDLSEESVRLRMEVSRKQFDELKEGVE